MTANSHPRFFYGWFIVLTVFLSTFVIAGAFVTFGQFIGPLSTTFGWSIALIGMASTVRQLTSMSAAFVVGRLTDWAGPRKVMTAGALFLGSAYCLLYVIADPLVFYLVFTIAIAVGFSMIGGTPAQAAVARWFRRKRGIALAIASMGGSMGGVIMAPAVQFLLGVGDWRIVFAVIGGSILLILFPLIVIGMRDQPEQVGTWPDGISPRLAPPTLTVNEAAASVAPEPGPTWSYRALWGSQPFWLLTTGYLFASSLYTLIEVYQFPILTSHGLDGSSAALFISIYSLSAALSKFGWGYVADHFDMRKVIVFALCANALVLASLAFVNTLPLFWLYTIVGGASGGGQSSLLPALIAEQFGHRSFGAVTSLFVPLSMLAPAILVPAAGYVFDTTHSYAPVFIIAAALAFVCSTSLLRLPVKARDYA